MHYSTYTQWMNRINKRFHNPNLHQKMFIKIQCCWGELISIDNFLRSGYQRNKKILLTDPVTSHLLLNLSTIRRATR